MRCVILAVILCLAALPPALADSSAPVTMAQADALLAAKDWAKAAQAYEAIVASGRGGPRLQYNLACAQARLGQHENAFVSLESALKGGFANLSILSSDEDLAPLRQTSRWPAFLESARNIIEPCRARPESRQFDFWIGTWDVQTSTGQPAGENTIDLILGDCVLLENWTSRGGGSGKSLNLFNAAAGFWQQTWVDAQGSVTEYRNGKYLDGVMRFTADSKGPDGKPALQKLAFFNLAPGKVRQFGERSDDGGKTWVVEYDLSYVRRGR